MTQWYRTRAMRLVLDKDPAILTVRRYAPGEIEIGSEILRAPCILSPQQLIRDWAVTSIAALRMDELEPLLAFRPSIVILGSDAPQARAPFELHVTFSKTDINRIILEAGGPFGRATGLLDGSLPGVQEPRSTGATTEPPGAPPA